MIRNPSQPFLFNTKMCLESRLSRVYERPLPSDRSSPPLTTSPFCLKRKLSGKGFRSSLAGFSLSQKLYPCQMQEIKECLIRSCFQGRLHFHLAYCIFKNFFPLFNVAFFNVSSFMCGKQSFFRKQLFFATFVAINFN